MDKPNPIIFMFSGQGSQYRQMGRELYDHQPVFRRWLHEGDRLVRDQLGFSLLDELYARDRKVSDVFSNTLATHPAIFVVEYAAAQTLLERGLAPDYVLGASMGSFAALAAAGVMGFDEALSAIVNQAQCLERHCRPGGMIAIMADPDLFPGTDYLRRHSVVAGVNFSRHFVVSALREQVPEIHRRLKESEVTAEVLAVSYAFHSPWMDDARQPVCEYLEKAPRRRPQLPIICCAQASSLSEVPPEYLWNVGREPVRFQSTIANLEAAGGWTYIDLGPSGTLANFVKYNLEPRSHSSVYPLMTRFGGELDKVDRLLATVGTARTSRLRGAR
jgi:acyl transferase domain-containing protein